MAPKLNVDALEFACITTYGFDRTVSSIPYSHDQWFHSWLPAQVSCRSFKHPLDGTSFPPENALLYSCARCEPVVCSEQGKQFCQSQFVKVFRLGVWTQTWASAAKNVNICKKPPYDFFKMFKSKHRHFPYLNVWVGQICHDCQRITPLGRQRYFVVSVSQCSYI